MTTTPAKTTRAKQIAECIEIVSRYFNTDSHRVLTSFNRPGESVKDARNLLWHHLHNCGMSYNSIGRIFKLSDVHIQKCCRQGMIRSTNEDRMLLATLPTISNSLAISHTQ